METGLIKNNSTQTHSLSLTPKGGVVTLLKNKRFDEIVKSVPNSVEKIMDAKLICDLTREVGREPLQEMLEREIIKLANQMNVANNVNATQVPFIAETLLDTYPTETLADFILVFKRGSIGFYGNSYHKLDCGTINDWMEKHIEEKSMYRERDNTSSKKKEEENKIDYEEYKRRIDAKQIEEREQKIKAIVAKDELAATKQSYLPNPTLLEISERKEKAARDRGLHLCNFNEIKPFKIEDQIIVARTKEEAQEIYTEVYL